MEFGRFTENQQVYQIVKLEAQSNQEYWNGSGKMFQYSDGNYDRDQNPQGVSSFQNLCG